jgi:phage FluMu protein Com
MATNEIELHGESMKTYKECAAEGEKFAQSMPQNLRQLAKVSITALAQFQAGLEVKEHCPKCNELITVQEFDPRFSQGWKLSCPCGKCDQTFRGL